jgi:hypothetical protein
MPTKSRARSNRRFDRETPSMTLVIETASGVYLRTILPAALLPEGIPVGDAAEDATKDAAARWGLPDFVFNSTQKARGSATREIGDAIVVAGSVGHPFKSKLVRSVQGTKYGNGRGWTRRSNRLRGKRMAASKALSQIAKPRW